MRQIYNLVRVDNGTKRFYYTCPVCGKVQTGHKVPFICRSKKMISRCEQGKSNPISQRTFNHAKAKNIQNFMRYLNFCFDCRRFVCDECYDHHNQNGACKICSKQQNQ